jgi:hypothetical protein
VAGTHALLIGNPDAGWNVSGRRAHRLGLTAQAEGKGSGWPGRRRWPR